MHITLLGYLGESECANASHQMNNNNHLSPVIVEV